MHCHFFLLNIIIYSKIHHIAKVKCFVLFHIDYVKLNYFFFNLMRHLKNILWHDTKDKKISHYSLLKSHTIKCTSPLNRLFINKYGADTKHFKTFTNV